MSAPPRSPGPAPARVVRVIGVLVPLALVLGACAPVLDPAWIPPQWTATQLEIAQEPLAPLDASPAGEWAAALQAERLRTSALSVQARFAFVPGVAAFNDAVTAVVRQAIAGREAATGVPYAPEVQSAGAGMGDRSCIAGSTTAPAVDVLADPALAAPAGSNGSTTVVCDILWAQGAYVGQRLRTLSVGAEGAISDRSVTLYADTTTGQVQSAPSVWVPEAAADLATDILETRRRDAGSLSLLPIEDPEAIELITRALESTTPAVGGGMQFTLAAGFTSPRLIELGIPATTADLTIRVPVDRARPLLTPFGQGLMDSAGAAYVGPLAASAADTRVDCALLPCVALTYDDGPSSLTPRLLDALAAARAPATLYVLGQYAAAAPDTVVRAASEGHEIGNHTWNHPSLPDLTAAEVRSQLDRTRALLRELSGQPVATFRPPYGEYDNAVLAAAGEPAILWTVDTRDWAGPADAVLLDRAINGARPGGVVLFHDTHERSVRLAPEVIAGLRDRGFSFATITQLFGGQLPASGAWRGASSPPAG